MNPAFDVDLMTRMSRSFPGACFILRRREGGVDTLPFASEGLMDLSGLRPEQLSEDARPLLARIHPHDRAPFLAAADASARTLSSWQGEYRLVHPEKGERWIEWRATPEAEPDGVVWTGFLHDISERRQREETWRRMAETQEPLLRALGDVGIQQMVIEEGRIVHVGNRALAHEFGFTDEQIDAHPPLESILHPDDRERVLDYHRRRLAGEPVPDNYELALMTQAGERRDFEVSIARVPGSQPPRLVSIAREISRRKRMEATLVARERELRALADSSPGMMGSFHRRPEGTFCMPYVSPNIIDLFGLRPDEVVDDATPLLALTHPDDAQRVADSIAESARAMTPWRCEYRIFHPVRGERWMEGHSNPMPHPDGGVIWYGYVHDITDRKQAEQRLQDALEFTQGVINAIPDLLFELNGEGRYLNIWTHTPERLAAQRQALLGHTVGEMLPSEAAATVMDALSEAQNHGLSFGKRIRLDLPQGTAWFELSVSRRPGGRPEELRFLVLSRDVSERLQAEEQIRRMNTQLEQRVQERTAQLEAANRELQQNERALRASERTYRTLAENLPDNLARYDSQCRITYLNPVLEKAGGFRLADVLGKTPLESWPGPIFEALQRCLQAVIASGQPDQIEFELPDANPQREPRHHQVTVVAERDERERIIGALAIGRDITAMVQAERRLAESHTRLRELLAQRESDRDEERRRIARELHDELGQVLTSLKLGLSTLVMQFGGELPALNERMQSLLALTDRSIQTVRSVATRLRPALLDMGVIPALQWLAGEFERHSGIACHLNLPEHLNHMGEARATALFRIAQEALTNIARHADATRVDFELMDVPDGAWHLEIRDDGKGFDARTWPKQCFGLIGMRERADSVGGQLSIDSTPGGGTRIGIHIPRPDVT